MKADGQHTHCISSQKLVDGDDTPTGSSCVLMKQPWLQAVSDMLTPLHIHDFLLLFSGQLISSIGDAFYLVALPWFMLSNEGGAQALGVVLSAYGIPRAGVLLLGGLLSDHLRPRRLMLLADIARIFLTGILAVLMLQGHPSLLLLCIVSALLGTFAGLFTPAAWSILPDVLPDESLQAGNALQTSSQEIASLVGSSMAGFVVSRFQSGFAMLIDALSFVASAVTLAAMHNRGRKQIDQTAVETLSGDSESNVSGTFRQLLRSSRYLQILLVMVIFMNLGNGATLDVALPAFVHDVLKAGANEYGFILTAFSLGAVVGALSAGVLGKIPHRGIVGLAFFMVQAVAIGSIPFLHNVVAICGVMLLAGTMNGLGNVIFITVMQQVLPRHLLGRIMSALAFANFGFYPLSVALGGSIVAHSWVILIFLSDTVLIAVPCVFGLFQHEFHEL